MTAQSLAALADDLEESLWANLLSPWFPACFDPAWGFRQDFARDWTPGHSRARSVVFQSRMTWVAATVAEIPGPRQAEFRQYASHGVQFLRDHFINPSDGAIIWMVDGDGKPVGDYRDQRHSYGASFALYALAAAARSLDSSEALQAAGQVFGWLENHARDTESGGYFETTDAKNRAMLVAPPGEPFASKGDAIGTAYGLKSQNTHLHLLEAFTEFLRVEDSPLVKERLREVQQILCERLFHQGSLHLFVTPSWQPVEGPASYGHDIEAAHLLMDAAMVLEGTLDSRTVSVAQALIEHTLAEGEDRQKGGIINLGTQAGEPLDTDKIWWVQAEAILGFVRGAELPNAPSSYLEAATRVWTWTKTHLIDPEFGGWFNSITAAGEVTPDGLKGNAWKAAYHDGRALLFSARALRRLATRL